MLTVAQRCSSKLIGFLSANRNSIHSPHLSPKRSISAQACRARRDERNSMTTATTLESKETVSLIASDKVEGTAVYGTDDKKIGKLERVMIDKISGKVAYAVLSFGGFLGMGEDYYPMPW